MVNNKPDIVATNIYDKLSILPIISSKQSMECSRQRLPVRRRLQVGGESGLSQVGERQADRQRGAGDRKHVPGSQGERVSVPIDQGPNSIGKEILTKISSKSYNKKFKKSVVYTFKLDFPQDFRQDFSPIESGPC